MKPQHTPDEWDIRYERDPFDSKQSTLRIIVAAFAPHMEEAA